MRRIVKWIVSERPLPGRPKLWEAGEEVKMLA